MEMDRGKMKNAKATWKNGCMQRMFINWSIIIIRIILRVGIIRLCAGTASFFSLPLIWDCLLVQV